MATRWAYLDTHIVRAREAPKDANSRGKLVATLVWGDRVRIVGSSVHGPLVDLSVRREENGKSKRSTVRCVLSKKVKRRDTGLLKTRFVDVGRGDTCIVETPRNKLLLIDGGEESHLHRYLSTAFGDLLAKGSIDCHAIVVTHGDADHFAGLIDIVGARNFRDKKKAFLKGCLYSWRSLRGRRRRLRRFLCAVAHRERFKVAPASRSRISTPVRTARPTAALWSSRKRCVSTTFAGVEG
jgi:hypothetical protein